jgi:hypothetical protein
MHSGAIHGAPGDTWGNVNAALRTGHRGLPRNTSLAELLVKHRNVRSRGYAPKLTIDIILKWADAHHARTGRWPIQDSGAVVGVNGETWNSVHWALYLGHRGLPGGSTLAKVLARHRNVPNRMDLPRLSHEKIIAWAKKHYERTNRWPNRFSGKVVGADAPGETWLAIELAVHQGKRGLKRGTTLNRLLAKYAGKRDRLNPPPLSIKKILAWADHHYEATGTLPNTASGRVLAARDESWNSVNLMMRLGKRGLPRGPGLRELLERKRAAIARASRSRLTRDLLLEWIVKHYELTGSPPNVKSGAVIDEPGENWRAIDAALRSGSRGTGQSGAWGRGGISLAAFIRGQYQPPFAGIGQRLTIEKITQWARDFKQRTGRWPSSRSAYVFSAPRSIAAQRQAGRSIEQDRPGERWSTIDRCLREGRRGLRAGSSLAKVVAAVRQSG